MSTSKYHEYLDRTGLAHFWGIISGLMNDISDEIGAPTQEQVDDWFERHPSAATSISSIYDDAGGTRFSNGDASTSDTYIHQTPTATEFLVNGGVEAAVRDGELAVMNDLIVFADDGLSEALKASGLPGDVTNIEFNGGRAYVRVEPHDTNGLLMTLMNGGSGGTVGSDDHSHQTIVGAERYWVRDSAKSDKAYLIADVTNDGVSPSARLRVESGGHSGEIGVVSNESLSRLDINVDRLYLDNKACYMTHGASSTVTVNANSYKDVSVTFGHVYASAPHVVVGLRSTSSAAAIGSLSVAVKSVTATGAVVRIFNNSSTAREPGFNWIAMG